MSIELTTPVALVHTSHGSRDHATPLTDTTRTFCGITGSDLDPLIESATTVHPHHITCDRCRYAPAVEAMKEEVV